MKGVLFLPRGSVLLYAVLIGNLAVLIAYVLFSYGQLLMQNMEYQQSSLILNRGLEQKAALAIAYDKSLNQDGSGFLDTLSCPSAVTLSGTTKKSTIATSPIYLTGTLFCSGTTADGNVSLTYNSAFTGFTTSTFASVSAALTSTAAGTHSGAFVNADATKISFTMGSVYSGYDPNQNSDNFRVYSTGSLLYPNNIGDNDTLARKIFFGVVRKGAGFANIFYNNADTNDYIAKNGYNTDPINILIGNVTNGYMLLDTDGPFRLKLLEFSSWAYVSSKILADPVEIMTFDSGTGVSGYLAFTGVLSSTGSARAFDFKNKNYALFLSYTGSSLDPSATHLRYRLSVMNTSGSGVYIVPLDDSSTSSLKMLSNDIMIDSEGKYLFRQSEVVVNK